MTNSHYRAVMGSFLLLVLSASSGMAQPQRSPQEDQAARAEERRQRDLERGVMMGTISLHEAAIQSGGQFVTTIGPIDEWVRESSLDGVTNKSDLVIIGRTIAASARAADDQRTILTMYTVQIEDTIKGSAPLPTSIVHVALPGGRVEFPDGTSAEVRSTHSLALGERYMLFLEQAPTRKALLGVSARQPEETYRTSTAAVSTDRDRVYVPYRNSLGLFHVAQDGKVRSLAQSQHDPLKRYDGRRAANLVTDLRRSVR